MKTTEQETMEERSGGAVEAHRQPAGKVPISVLIPTKNEQENIRKCLESVAWADEICVVDSHSTDETRRIAHEFGAVVVDFVWDSKGPRKRNWALEHYPWKHEWLLLLDADEEVAPELRDEIAATVRAKTNRAGFLIRFHYYFLGRKLRHGDPLWKLCLIRHSLARFETIDVPEVTGYDVELHEWVRVNGSVGRLRSVILHRDFESLQHHFHRHNIYSDWEALLRTRYRHRNRLDEVQPRLLGSSVERRRFFKRLFLSLPGKPWLYFFYSYLLRGGFLDGREGFIYNVLKSLYWYQVSVKEYELRSRAPQEETDGGHAAALDQQRDAQLHFYREGVDPEEEISRPRCYPRPVQYLLDFKIQTAWQLLDGEPRGAQNQQEKILVVCCGSGMEAEMVARTGRRVIALDLSPAAAQRARERSRRYGADYALVVGDAENLPFRSDAVNFAFVHDGLHHLPDAYRGVREMLRVARRAVVIAEPADAALTHLAIKLGISGEYEEAGNYVYRLRKEKLIDIFRECGASQWRFRRNLIYYQPWTFRFYRLFDRPPLFWLFQAGFHLCNLLIGRWGNSLRAVAWKDAPLAKVDTR